MSLTAFNKNGVLVEFNCERIDSGVTAISMSARNNNSSPISDFVFQAAVPKVNTEELLMKTQVLCEKKNRIDYDCCFEDFSLFSFFHFSKQSKISPMSKFQVFPRLVGR